MLTLRKAACWTRNFYCSSKARIKVMSSSMFPTTIQDFGYTFNEEGKLRKIIPDTEQPGTEPFQFGVSTNHAYNQERYEALGDLITEHVYSLLEGSDVGLERLQVPKDSEKSTSSFIFASKDALSNDKLMILIHGSGVVRAGQWARSLIINDSLLSGTQIPYIKQAMKLGFGVLVLNTNDNRRSQNGTSIPIAGSSNPLEHASSVWEAYVKPARAKYIAIVAHSFGGVCTMQLMNQYYDDFTERVFAIALTDSVHELALKNVKTDVMQYLQMVACNWVSSCDPLDEPVRNKADCIPQVSAGHSKHEMTSSSSMGSVFKFIKARLPKSEN